MEVTATGFLLQTTMTVTVQQLLVTASITVYGLMLAPIKTTIEIKQLVGTRHTLALLTLTPSLLVLTVALAEHTTTCSLIVYLTTSSSTVSTMVFAGYKVILAQQEQQEQQEQQVRQQLLQLVRSPLALRVPQLL
jgi:hypothetical protein